MSIGPREVQDRWRHEIPEFAPKPGGRPTSDLAARCEALGSRYFPLANGGCVVIETGENPQVVFIHEHDDSGFEDWLAEVERKSLPAA